LLNGTNDVDGSALQSAGATKKLAYELAADGHFIDVIVSDSNLLANEKVDSADRRIRYHAVDHESRIAFTGRFMKASPGANRAFSQALPQWEKFSELHLQEPFDVLDTNHSVLSALMPSMCCVVPTVCAVHEQMAMFQEPASPFEPLKFDLQLLAMLERLTLNLVDRISVSSIGLEQRLHRKLGTSLNKTDAVGDGVYTSAKIAQYRSAVESGKNTNQSKVYLKPPTDLSTDVVMIFRAYDEMIYNFLYQNSFRFRFYHWWSLLKSNPTLFQNKMKQLLLRSVGRPQNEL
jgi:hypothetical protein